MRTTGEVIDPLGPPVRHANYGICPEGAREVDTSLAMYHGNDAGAQCGSHLHRGRAHTTGGAQYHHGLPGLQTSPGDEGEICALIVD